MIRYRLLAPPQPGSQPDRPHRQAIVSLDSDYCDARAPIQVKGSSRTCGEVLQALLSSYGAGGSPLEEVMTPEDLAVAMASPMLRRFQPELMEGQEVLLRRRPPQGTPEQITTKVAVHLSRLTVDYLPAIDDLSSYPGRIMLSCVVELLFVWSYWRPAQVDVEQAVETLTPRLEEELRARFEERRRSPEQPRHLAATSLATEQVRGLSRTLIEAVDSADPTDPIALVAALRSRIGKLGS